MTIEEIKNCAKECFNVSDLKGRKIGVVYAKIAICMVLHHKGYKVSEIADILGLNHSTITVHIKSFDDRIKYDEIFRNGYNKFNEKVN